MRFLLIILALSQFLAAEAQAGIRTGADLAQACRALASGKTDSSQAASADACRNYLAGFVQATVAGQEAELRLRVQGSPGGSPDRGCVRLPDNLRFEDFAKKIVDYDAANPDLRTGPAYILARKTAETHYPCP